MLLRCSDALRSWADRLMETKPFKLVAVATANKLARIAFALMRDEAHYAGAPALLPIVRRLNELDHEIGQSDQAILALARADNTARRLMTIPGIGPVTASALAASIHDISAFSGPREFAAFLGLTPRQSSSGGKERLGRVSKMGNRYLRKLLVVGAHAVLFHRRRADGAKEPRSTVLSVEEEAVIVAFRHKVRELLVAQRTQLLNALRSHLAEIGIIAAQGPNNARALAILIMEGNDMIPAIVRPAHERSLVLDRSYRYKAHGGPRHRL